MFRSIQWKIVFVYVLLILLAMELVGVYLLQSLERFYLADYSKSLGAYAQIIAGLANRYLEGEPWVERLTAELEALPLEADVAVVDGDGVVLTAVGREKEALVRKQLTRPEVAKALSGTRGESLQRDPDTGEWRMYLAAPVRSRGRVIGAVYLAGSAQRQVFRVLDQIRVILFTATLVALAVMIALGSALARTITGPILELTSRAGEMAAGNFDKLIEIRSDDEVGRLAAMFNHLSLRLKQTLGEISREKSKVDAIVTHMADGMFAVDGEFTIVLMNPAAAGLLGVSADEAVGKKAGDALPWPGEGDTLGAVMSSGAQAVEEIRLGDAPDRIIKAHFAPFRSAGGRVTGVVVVLHDVTEQNKLETLRREFVANVSHELKTPLTTMKSYLETLLDGAASEPRTARRFLGVVSSETERMIRLVNNLLQLTNIDYRAARWEPVPLSLKRTVDEALSRLSFPVAKKALDVRLELPPLPRVLGDHDGLMQVFINIISNAIEFTPEGGRITVAAALEDGLVRVRIADTGIGIPKADLSRIFERFYRVDKARSRQLGGTGLGLSISKEIIDAHGGEIGIESAVGRGTEVWFTLPTAPDFGAPNGGEPLEGA